LFRFQTLAEGKVLVLKVAREAEGAEIQFMVPRRVPRNIIQFLRSMEFHPRNFIQADEVPLVDKVPLVHRVPLGDKVPLVHRVPLGDKVPLVQRVPLGDQVLLGVVEALSMIHIG